MLSLVTRKNVSWPRLIWPTLYMPMAHFSPTDRYMPGNKGTCSNLPACYYLIIIITTTTTICNIAIIYCIKIGKI